VKRFNDWLALRITTGVASMWCAYAFAVLAVAGFPGLHATVQLYVQWVSQTFIQLTMLSVIMVGQNLQNKRHDDHAKKLDAIHKHLGIKQ
jgi:hypothetical protein